MRKIKAIIYGAGTVGQLMTRLMLEKGVEVTGAIDSDPKKAGRDLGEVAGLPRKLGIEISDRPEEVLATSKADIAMVAVFDDLLRMQAILQSCVESKCNVLTTSSEALYPWHSSPQLAEKLDLLAKKHGVTITGSGNQDFYLVNAASLLTGVCQDIRAAKLVIRTNTENYGPEFSRSVHIGEAKQDVELQLAEQKGKTQNFMVFCLSSIINDLDLSVGSIEEGLKPITAYSDMESRALGKTVRRGQVTGMHQTVRIQTKEGPVFQSDGWFQMFPSGTEDTKEWLIEGTPSALVRFEKLDGPFTTGTQMVNRIPDVINAEPGLVTIDRLPKLKYRAHPLHHYLQKRENQERR
jgi:4-hydroxy-tetrahydrodipicolinate reductase